METSIQEDIEYLTETLVSPVEKRIELRPTLQAALASLGYSDLEITDALDVYYAGLRTLH